MEERLKLLFTQEELKRIHQSHVLIFGLGGVGGTVLLALARTGIKNFTIVDFDVVNESNLNRQMIATRKTLSWKKIDAAKDMLDNISNDINVNGIDAFVEKENIESFFSSRIDYCIDCIDSVASKCEIIAYCKNHQIPVISSMGAARRMKVNQFTIMDLNQTKMDPLARTMRYQLKQRGITHVKVGISLEEPMKQTEEKNILGSCIFGPSAMGLVIAEEVIRDIKGGNVNETNK